ncbi:MAG: methanol--corrinoid methyltransferase [Firmicutes bacterium]|jgi:methanol--5-hydroxybenzimidazolylcobamide Co-methyltransferase|nr:methanol--corrinoid methyltransferase [Bacillota bacterium]
MKMYSKLALDTPAGLTFGKAPHPVTTKSGLVIGGGLVYPEVNFTLPPLDINADTMPTVREQYTNMIDEICRRAVELQVPGLVVEFELLPPMTLVPEWGAQITAIVRETLDRYAESDGLTSALRVTPNDIREYERPPVLREGHLWERMMHSFELNAQAGADFLSIESTGGKEVHDDAIIMCDLPGVLFSLGILGCRDMTWLSQMITDTAERTGTIAAGDSACGFGNTAMMLAEKRYIPRVWAAVIRVMTVARSLVAYEQGAVGPGKDCAYENPYLKAITGYPMSGEGAEAACAHLSPVGNIAKTAADLWSNESVQNLRLLGGMAPTVSLEQLVYATRLMNVALSKGAESVLLLRDWFTESDARFDPQAYVLRPDVVIELAKEIVAAPTPYLRTRQAALATLACLRNAAASGHLDINEPERAWLDRLSRQADTLPDDEGTLIGEISPTLDRGKVRLDQYGLNA